MFNKVPFLAYICVENETMLSTEKLFRNLRKGLLEFCVIRILKDGEAYPANVVERLKSAGLHMPEGTLYPLLNRLKDEGYLAYSWKESSSGPPRKYFRLTEKGLDLAGQYQEAWRRLKEAIDRI